jgi:hypothetical protein
LVQALEEILEKCKVLRIQAKCGPFLTIRNIAVKDRRKSLAAESFGKAAHGNLVLVSRMFPNRSLPIRRAKAAEPFLCATAQLAQTATTSLT